MSRQFKVALAPLILILLILLLDPGVMQLAVPLLAGWVFSFMRLLRSCPPGFGPPGLWTVLALILLIAGTHRFASWLRDSGASNVTAPTPPPWRWKWTLSGFGILFLALLAMGSAILTTHQVFWLSRSSEPWVVDPRSYHLFLLGISNQLQSEAQNQQWDREKTQAAFVRLAKNGKTAWEELDPVWVEQGSNQLSAILLIPRKRTSRRPTGFVLIRPADACRIQKLNTLPSVLASLGVAAPAPHPAPAQ